MRENPPRITGSTVVITCFAAMAALASWVAMPNTLARTLGLGYIVMELTASVAALVVLRRVEQRELDVIGGVLGHTSLSSPSDVAAVFDRSFEALDGAYATAANSLAGLGLVGSATFLIIGSAEGSAVDNLLAVAPKAFAATAFALLCSTVVALRGHAGAVRPLRAWRNAALTATHSVAPHASRAEAAVDTGGVLARALDHFEAALHAIASRNDRIAESVEQLVGVTAARTAAEAEVAEKLQRALVPLISALGEIAGKLDETVISAVVGTARELPELRRSMDLNQSVTARLNQILTDERKGLLEAHVEILRDESAKLMRETVNQLTSEAAAAVTSHIETIRGKVEAHAEIAYERAFNTAAESLRQTLRAAGSHTHDLNVALEGAVAQLIELQQQVAGIGRSMATGSEEAERGLDRFRGVADELSRTLRALNAPATEGATSVILEVTNATRELREAAAFVADQYKLVHDERIQLAGFKTQLLEISKQRPASPHRG